MLFPSLAGPAVFVAGLVLMFILVPWERVRDLGLVGLAGGLGVALLLIYLMQNIFGFWLFRQADVVNIAGMPFFLMAAWMPIVITFSHVMAQYTALFPIAVVLLAFPLGATLLHVALLANGMLAYNNWNLSLTYVVSVIIHAGIALYLYATGRLENLHALVETDS